MIHDQGPDEVLLELEVVVQPDCGYACRLVVDIGSKFGEVLEEGGSKVYVIQHRAAPDVVKQEGRQFEMG